MSTIKIRCLKVSKDIYNKEVNFNNKFTNVGLTYDDVLILPEYTDIKPSQIDISTNLSKNIKLNIPFISSAMDTVTEDLMAIAMAKEGGIGVIHRNLSIDNQAEHVYRVKRYNSEIIYNPISIQNNSTIKDLYNLCKRYHVSGLPVVNKDNILIGIITKRDIRFIKNSFNNKELTYKVENFMTHMPLITGQIGISRKNAFHLLKKNKVEKLPLIDNKRKLKGLITVKDFDQKKQFPLAAKDINGRLLVGAAIGIFKDSWKRAMTLIEAGVDALFLDTANGHNSKAYKMIKRLKKESIVKKVDIIGGQAATYECARSLMHANVDAIKVGVGPGSICTTRIVAGVGVPQITAINESYKAVYKSSIPIIADGGIKHSGDIGKALLAGSSSIMIGSLFAGCDESPGYLTFFNGKQYKSYRGMGSLGAIIARGNSQSYSGDKYYQETSKLEDAITEGIEGQVPYTGPLRGVVNKLVGGLRKTMFYVGSRSILDFKKKGRFIRITTAGLKESHPHDIYIPKSD